MKEAAFSLAEAKFATGDFNQVVLQNVTKAQIKIRTKKDNVAGMYRFNTCNLLTEILIGINVFSYRSRHNLMGWHVDSSDICVVASAWSAIKQDDFIIVYIVFLLSHFMILHTVSAICSPLFYVHIYMCNKLEIHAPIP